MNLHYLATLLSLASSASEAKNLRFEKPERILGGLKESQTHNQNNIRIETNVEAQVRILKSNDGWVKTFNAICILPEECDDVDENELEKMAEHALKDFNSDDYSSCDNCPTVGDRWCCYSKSGDAEQFGTVLHQSCNTKKVEKDLEDEMSSAWSGSRSKNSKRVRMLRLLKSGLSSSPDDADFNMACFRGSQVNTRGCDGEDLDLEDLANQLASDLSSGSSFDLGGRRLKKGKGKTKVAIAEVPKKFKERCYRKDTDDIDEFNEGDLVGALATALDDAFDN